MTSSTHWVVSLFLGMKVPFAGTPDHLFMAIPLVTDIVNFTTI